jgi:hypothetical protein
MSTAHADGPMSTARIDGPMSIALDPIKRPATSWWIRFLRALISKRRKTQDKRAEMYEIYKAVFGPIPPPSRYYAATRPKQKRKTNRKHQNPHPDKRACN